MAKKEYAQYREAISADFARVPWKYQVPSRAKRIAEKAKQCIDARKNESGWRLSLESEVMARFTVEIAWLDKVDDNPASVILVTRAVRCLARAADEDVEWDAGPLVWFLAYKGEQWRVHAAYVDERDGKTFYRVVRLWSGEVDSLDNALRLLLIIDYIADWARDIYREGIARSLYKLASSDSTSLAQDEDIFSLAGNVADWISANPSGDEFGKCAAYEDPLHELDCKEGVLRDKRFICTELVGLLITAENLDEFLRTGNTDDETRKLTTSLLYSIADSFQVKGSVLNDLETSWTGFDKSLPEMPHPEETFLVVITSRFYLTSKWDQVRELAYVAVSKSLVKDLRGIARVPNNTFRSLQEAPMSEPHYLIRPQFPG
ncbi:hypothetical protein FPRO06_00146 [Fusarium proliferatum]|nr:hypothetical protein FPRO06_00146 [Fusarium proliferatum]